eukprot:scaffold473262_cov23-Prasinocladus_malaysianus.AAC.1
MGITSAACFASSRALRHGTRTSVSYNRTQTTETTSTGLGRLARTGYSFSYYSIDYRRSVAVLISPSTTGTSTVRNFARSEGGDESQLGNKSAFSCNDWPVSAIGYPIVLFVRVRIPATTIGSAMGILVLVLIRIYSYNYYPSGCTAGVMRVR